LSTAAGLGPRRSEAILTPYSPTPSVPVPPLRRDLRRSLAGLREGPARWAKQAQRGDAVPVGGGETLPVGIDPRRDTIARGPVSVAYHLVEEDPTKLWSHYLLLTAVEEAFKNLKGDLATSRIAPRIPGQDDGNADIKCHRLRSQADHAE
jgi:hypothetical protein